MTRNKQLAKIFSELALFLEMEGGIPFRHLAYSKVAEVLEGMETNVEDIYEKEGRKGIEDITGVGKDIADKIIEYTETGKMKYYDDYKKKVPVDVSRLVMVEGIGPKTVKALWQELGVKNLKDLEKAAKDKKIAPLFNFGEKTEKNIIEAIKFLKRSHGRFRLDEIAPRVKEIENGLKSLPEVDKISVAGSLRRMKETIGDVDFLISVRKTKECLTTKAAVQKVMNYFTSIPGVIKIWGKGGTKSSIKLEEGFDCDLRIVQEDSFGSALQYFTGSKEHNIALRIIAIKKGMKLSEYGIFKGKKMLGGWDEESIYHSLGLLWIEPELREDAGEIESSFERRLPSLIRYDSVKGDLHCHSDWDGGVDSIENMAKKAMEMGYEYIGISDHTKFLKIENGLDEKQLSEQRREIDNLNFKFQISNFKFRILQGCEANILNDGSIDIDDKALAKLDYAIAGVHSSHKMEKKDMTERIIKAMKNPYVKILSHPTGRILKRRDEYQCDFAQLLRAAKETKTIFEINSSPYRLDLKDTNIRKAKEAGVKMIINTDSHNKEQMGIMKFGIAQARRGWAEEKDIINTQPSEKLLEFFKI
ncbi:DNA polymerase III [Candidatus Parcubacteria bacterium A4]|nr:MAG: DNA polymerase III [Candidatus Parcubacteria bacterium A4]